MKIFKYMSGDVPRWAYENSGSAFALDTGTLGDAQALNILNGGDAPIDAESVAMPSRFLPPLVAGSTVYCVGLNYMEHVQQTQREVTEYPVMFTRNHASLVGHGETMFVPRVSHKFDYEGEIAVVIGRTGRNIDQGDAMSYVCGITCFNDGSLRDHQKHSLTAGKNFHRSGACGPWIVKREIDDRLDRTMVMTRLNDEQVQGSDTSLLIHSVSSLIAYLSTIVELQPGDLLATGTPGGTGNRRSPQLFMKAGDVVEVEVGGVGVLRNPIAQAE